MRSSIVPDEIEACIHGNCQVLAGGEPAEASGGVRSRLHVHGGRRNRWTSVKSLEMMHEDARRLLERIEVLRHPCDLDLLLFFARHPRTLITSEQLASWLGYELKQIADSLEVLLSAEVLTRAQNPTHAARMYVFNIGGAGGGWLPSLLALASTREGRLAMVKVLASRPPKHSDDPPSHRTGDAVVTSRPRPVVVRRNRDQDRDTMAG